MAGKLSGPFRHIDPKTPGGQSLEITIRRKTRRRQFFVGETPHDGGADGDQGNEEQTQQGKPEHDCVCVGDVPEHPLMNNPVIGNRIKGDEIDIQAW